MYLEVGASFRARKEGFWKEREHKERWGYHEDNRRRHHAMTAMERGRKPLKSLRSGLNVKSVRTGYNRQPRAL